MDLLSILSSPTEFSLIKEESFDTPSKLPATLFIMCRFIKRRHIPRYPISHPINHPRERNNRVPIKPLRRQRIIIPTRLRLLALENRFPPEAAAKLVRRHADAHVLRPADVQRRRRRGRVREHAEDLRVGVALPDDGGVRGADGDGFAAADPAGHVVQDAVAHVDGVVEPGEAAGRAVAAGEVGEDVLTPDAARGVVARGARLDGLVPPAAADGREGVDAERGEGDDARGAETLGDEGGDVRVHRPGEARVLADAEFLPGHVHDVGHVRQGSHGVALEQVADNGFDVPAFKPGSQVFFGKACDADDPFGRHRTLGHAGDRRTDFATDSKEHDVSIHTSEEFGQPYRRSRQQFFEHVLRFNGVGKIMRL